jgi:hypothetical protein
LPRWFRPEYLLADRSNTRRPCRRRSATSRPQRGARVIRQERLLLAVPADHHLADEVQALEVEALAGETLILSQYEEDAGFADYVTDFVAAARACSIASYKLIFFWSS